MPADPPNLNGHTPQDPGPALSAAPTPPVLTLPTPALTPDESQILEYLLHPDADPAAVAAAYSLTLTDLALWLRQPHIQQAHDALRQLHTLQRRAWQDQVTKEAVETLRNVMHAAEDPVERRRAAAAILRALTRTNRTRRPTHPDTNRPTSLPTHDPTDFPTNHPSDQPTDQPTSPTAAAPTTDPTTDPNPDPSTPTPAGGTPQSPPDATHIRTDASAHAQAQTPNQAQDHTQHHAQDQSQDQPQPHRAQSQSEPDSS